MKLLFISVLWCGFFVALMADENQDGCGSQSEQYPLHVRYQGWKQECDLLCQQHTELIEKRAQMISRPDVACDQLEQLEQEINILVQKIDSLEKLMRLYRQRMLAIIHAQKHKKSSSESSD